MLESIFSSSGPFIIVFREALEAALIICVIVACLNKTGQISLKKYIWTGAGAAVISSIIIGIVLERFYSGLSGASSNMFEGTASITAAAVLTYMIFWMAKHASTIKEEMQSKVDAAITKKRIFGIFFLSFIVVFREGVETVLFLVALSTIDITAVTIGTVSGIGVVAVVTFLMFEGIYRIDTKKFFRYTSIILMIFAAGIIGYGIHEYLEAAEYYGVETGFLGQHAYDINPPDQANIFHEKGMVGSVLKTLVGYDGNPEWLRVFAYLGYWIVVGVFLMKIYKHKPSHERSRIFAD